MITVRDFANDVNLSIETVLKLCKNLNINVDSADDFLSENDVNMLNELIENTSFSHQGDNDNFNDKNTGGAGGGGSGGANDVNIDKKALRSGISKLNKLANELSALESALNSIVVIAPVSAALLESAKSYLKNVIGLHTTLSANSNAVAKLIYNDDKMFEFLFGENGIAYEYDLDNIDQLMSNYAKNENLSKDKLKKLQAYGEFKNDLIAKIENGEFSDEDKYGYSFYNLDKINQIILGSGFNIKMFDNLTSNLENYNSKMDNIKKQNKAADDEARTQKTDKNSTANILAMGLSNGEIMQDSVTGELYQVNEDGSRGNRIVVRGSEELTIAGNSKVTNGDGDVIGTVPIHCDVNGNEVIVIDGNNTVYDMESGDLPSTVEPVNFRNSIEKNVYENMLYYLAKKGVLIDASMDVVQVDTNSIDYVLGAGHLAGKFDFDEKTGNYYETDGHRRIVVDGTEQLTERIGGYTTFANGVEFTVNIYHDEDGNEVAVIDKNTTINVGTLNNEYEKTFYNKAFNYVLSKQEGANPTFNIPDDTVQAYLSSQNVYYRWDIDAKKYVDDKGRDVSAEIVKNNGVDFNSSRFKEIKHFDKYGNEVDINSDKIYTTKYFGNDGQELLSKNLDGKYNVRDIAGFQKFYDALFKNEHDEYLSVITDSNRQLINFLSQDYSKGSYEVSWNDFKNNTIVGGYYITDTDKLSDSNGKGIRTYTDDISKLSSAEKATLEVVTLGDLVAGTALDSKLGDLYSSTFGTLIGDGVDELIASLNTNHIDLTNMENKYLSLLGGYNKFHSDVDFELSKYNQTVTSYYLSHSIEFNNNCHLTDNAKESLNNNYNDLLSKFTYTSYDSDGKNSGSSSGKAVLELNSSEDMGTIYMAIAHGLAEVTSDGRLYYADKGIYITVKNDGVDAQTWNALSKVLISGNVEDVVESDNTIGLWGKISNAFKKSILSEAKLTESEYSNLNSTQVTEKVSEFMDNAFTVMHDGKLSVYANEENSKYILNSVLNGSNGFKLDGNKVTYVDPKTGRTLYVFSEDNCLELALKKLNDSESKKSYLQSDFVKDSNNLNFTEVADKISKFKNDAFTVMQDGKLSVYANEEYSKYILNSVLNGTNGFKLDGNKVTYVDPKTGRTLYVFSEDNCLEVALENLNFTRSKKSYLQSDAVSNFNYLNNINYAFNMYGSEGVFNFINDIKSENDSFNNDLCLKNINLVSTLNSRAVDVKEQFDKEFADKYPVDASLFSVPLGLIEGAKTFYYATDKAVNGSNDTKIYSINTYSSADVMRGRVGENIKMREIDEYGNPTVKSEFESLLYSTTMSMADNVFNSAVFGSLGLPMGVGLALSSFDNSYNDAISRGINQQNAFNYALSLAMLEGATEQLSWNNLAKVTGVSWFDDALKNIDIDDNITKAFNNKLAMVINGENGKSLYSIAKGITGIASQGVSEGVEELVSSVGGRFIDSFNGDKSSQFLRYKDLISQGISSEKALEIIALENLDEDLQSFVSGMMSGGMMSAGRVTLNSVSADGQFRNALEYNLANSNYNSSFQYINDYLSANSKGITSDIKFTDNLETAFVNKDYSSVINQILNNSSISLDVKNKVSATIIDALSSTYQIDESNANDLLSKVKEYNKKVQEEQKKIRDELYNEMKNKLKENGINSRNMTLETMMKKYPDFYYEVVDELEKFNLKNNTKTEQSSETEVKEQEVIKQETLNELDILAAMQSRLDSMGISTEGKTLNDLKLEHPDVYQEVVDSYNKDSSEVVVKSGVAGAAGVGIVSGITGNSDIIASDNLNNDNNVIVNNESDNKSKDKLEESKKYLLSESSLLSNFHKIIKSYYEGKYGNVIHNIEDALNSMLDLSDLNDIQLDNLSMYENKKIIEFLSKIGDENIKDILFILNDNAMLDGIISNINDKSLIKKLFNNISFDDAKTLFKNMSIENIINVVNNSYYKARFKLATYLDLCSKINIEVTNESMLYFFDNSSSVFLDLYSKKYNGIDLTNINNINLLVEDIENILSWTYVSLNDFINNNSLNSLLNNAYFLEEIIVRYYGQFKDIGNLFSSISNSVKKQLNLSDRISSDIKENIKIELSLGDFISDIKNGEIDLGVSKITLYNGKVISISELLHYIEQSNMMTDLFASILYFNDNCFESISDIEILYGVVQLFDIIDNLMYKLNFDSSDLSDFNDFYKKYLLHKDSNYVKNALLKMVENNQRFSTDFNDTIYVENVKSGADQHVIADLFNPNNFVNPSVVRLQKALIKQVQEKFPGMSADLAKYFLRRIDSDFMTDKNTGNVDFSTGTGGICNYADIANYIFDKFKNKQKQFEKIFGFPMYIDGKLNDAQLLCDMFINISGLIVENNGVFDNVLFGDDRYAILNGRYNHLTNNTDMFDIYRMDLIEKYLKEKGIIKNIGNIKQYKIIDNRNGDKATTYFERQYLANNILSSISEALSKGHHISIVSYDYFELYDADNKNSLNPITYNFAHIMTIYGIDNGRILLESWGKRYYIDISSMLSKGIKFTISGLEINESNLEFDKVTSISDDKKVSETEKSDARINSRVKNNLDSNFRIIVKSIIDGKRNNVHTYDIFKHDSNNESKRLVLERSISKGINKFINDYADKVFYDNKTGNVLLLESLYNYLVTTYNITDNVTRERLYRELYNNGSSYVDILKVENAGFTLFGHIVNVEDVRMYMFSNYLANINPVYDYISDSIKEISVEYGINPDDFIMSLNNTKSNKKSDSNSYKSKGREYQSGNIESQFFGGNLVTDDGNMELEYYDDSLFYSDGVYDDSFVDTKGSDGDLSALLDQSMDYNEEIDSQIGNEYAIEVDGYKVFSKDFVTSIRQMGNHFGDAGINNQELGKKVNEMFLQGKTASMILSLLEGNERLEFENYLNNTIEGRFLAKITDVNLIKAVSIYTRIGYNNINSALRTGNMDGSIKYTNPLTKDKESILVKDLIESIDKVISLYVGLDSNTVLYRAVSLSAFIKQNEPFRKAFESIQNKHDVNEIYGVLKNFVGFKFSDKGYMSTSPGYNTSFAKKAYPIVLEILAPEGTPGAYLNQISKQYNVENEFLLDKGTNLRIVDVKLYDDMGDYNAYDRVVVRCEVVPDDVDVKVEETVVQSAMDFSGVLEDDGDSDLEYFDDSSFYGDDDVEEVNVNEKSVEFKFYPYNGQDDVIVKDDGVSINNADVSVEGLDYAVSGDNIRSKFIDSDYSSIEIKNSDEFNEGQQQVRLKHKFFSLRTFFDSFVNINDEQLENIRQYDEQLYEKMKEAQQELATAICIITPKQIIFSESTDLPYSPVVDKQIDFINKSLYEDKNLDLANGNIIIKIGSDGDAYIDVPNKITEYQYRSLKKFNMLIKEIFSNERKIGIQLVNFTSYVSDYEESQNSIDNTLAAIEDNMIISDDSVDRSLEIDLKLGDIELFDDILLKYSDLIDKLNLLLKRSDNIVSDMPQSISEFIVFNKKFSDALVQLSNYFGDAGERINGQFLTGMTAEQILQSLSLQDKVKFERFLQDTYEGRFLSKLNSEQVKSLSIYTGGFYKTINGKLRELKGSLSDINGAVNGVEIKDLIKNIDDAIRNFNFYSGFDQSMVFYRGVDVDSFIGQNKFYARLFHGLKYSNDLYALETTLKLLIGKKITDYGYMSASPGYNQSFAKNKNIVLEIIAPSGTVGAYINQISKEFNFENEYLFARNTVFRILEIIRDVELNRVIVRCVVDS